MHRKATFPPPSGSLIVVAIIGLSGDAGIARQEVLAFFCCHDGPEGSRYIRVAEGRAGAAPLARLGETSERQLRGKEVDWGRSCGRSDAVHEWP